MNSFPTQIIVTIYDSKRQLDMQVVEKDNRNRYENIMFQLMNLFSTKLRAAGMQQVYIDEDCLVMCDYSGVEVAVNTSVDEIVCVYFRDKTNLNIPVPNVLLEMINDEMIDTDIETINFKMSL